MVKHILFQNPARLDRLKNDLFFSAFRRRKIAHSIWHPSQHSLSLVTHPILLESFGNNIWGIIKQNRLRGCLTLGLIDRSSRNDRVTYSANWMSSEVALGYPDILPVRSRQIITIKILLHLEIQIIISIIMSTRYRKTISLSARWHGSNIKSHIILSIIGKCNNL